MAAFTILSLVMLASTVPLPSRGLPVQTQVKRLPKIVPVFVNESKTKVQGLDFQGSQWLKVDDILPLTGYPLFRNKRTDRVDIFGLRQTVGSGKTLDDIKAWASKGNAWLDKVQALYRNAATIESSEAFRYFVKESGESPDFEFCRKHLARLSEYPLELTPTIYAYEGLMLEMTSLDIASDHSQASPAFVDKASDLWMAATKILAEMKGHRQQIIHFYGSRSAPPRLN